MLSWDSRTVTLTMSLKSQPADLTLLSTPAKDHVGTPTLFPTPFLGFSGNSGVCWQQAAKSPLATRLVQMHSGLVQGCPVSGFIGGAASSLRIFQLPGLPLLLLLFAARQCLNQRTVVRWKQNCSYV